jgi:polyhydroxyalkanoate synthesis regulator phasin
MTTTSDSYDKLAERLDDIRGSQSTFAVEMARMAGKLEAMEGQLTTMQRTLADVNTLRENVTRLQEKVSTLQAKEFRQWVEKLAAGAIGGAVASGAQYLILKG